MELFVPVFIGIVIFFGYVKKVPVFDAFVDGAKSGFATLLSIAPTLVGLVFAINMLNASGFFDVIGEIFKPLAEDVLGFPTEIMPMALLRPVSGGGSTALLTNILKNCGADSFAGMVASVLAGSTETTFYCVAVYFGSVGIKNTRHTLVASLVADAVAVVMSVVTVKCFFGF